MHAPALGTLGVPSRAPAALGLRPGGPPRVAEALPWRGSGARRGAPARSLPVPPPPPRGPSESEEEQESKYEKRWVAGRG
jgi:hypothetical protein